MFRVTRGEDQAMRLVMRLGTAGRQLTLGEMSVAENLPEPTVAKLLGILRRGGVVEAVRGRHGGYALASEPESISAASVLRCIGGDSAFGYPCHIESVKTDCPRTGNCGLRPVWLHLENRVNDVLENTSIADLLQREAAAQANLQELWPLLRE